MRACSTRSSGMIVGELVNCDPPKDSQTLDEMLLECTEGSRVARIRGGGAMPPPPVLDSSDADGLRASQLQHAVEHVDRHVHLRRLTLVRVRAQPVPDHALEPADGGLGAGTPVIP